MRMPRFRFTVRRMMAAVAISACLVGKVELDRRSEVYVREARRCAVAKVMYRGLMTTFATTARPEFVELCRREYAANLARAESAAAQNRKYTRAARYP